MARKSEQDERKLLVISFKGGVNLLTFSGIVDAINTLDSKLKVFDSKKLNPESKFKI